MMKLRHLFGNEALAQMLLGNWAHDEDSTNMFKYFRISSNVIYPFTAGGETHFLRFAPAPEKDLNNVVAEIEFLDYLKKMQYPAVEAIDSKNRRKLELVQTPWGEYISTAFKGVPGIPLNETILDDDIVFGYGKALGRLHKLSVDYLPLKHKRWSWKEVLDWCCVIISDFPGEEAALLEVKLLRRYLSGLAVTNDNYGLVHYDFETDNVYFDKLTEGYHVIDFDDAMYHWFAMDIDQALDSLQDDMEQENCNQAKVCFISGYRSEWEISDETLSLLPVFRRFAKLYSYTRIRRSMSEAWHNEPEWMLKLRSRLDKAIKSRSSDFGKAINL